ncbi:non-structural maintenance of chromosomes element 1 homolog isoform X2 [Eurosta solidaginis]|uniref:non-structural maintenance of chromosomes element 1 homolog isoform X2 n=1 Tax=Eurosta solidaginis TaxID=178769 RepID=UPI003531124E
MIGSLSPQLISIYSEMLKKSFLQTCINHGSLSTQQIDQILQPIRHSYGGNDEEHELKKLVQEINSDIKEFGQELSFVNHPLSDTEYLVFGLTFETPACQLQHHYSESDQIYFAKLMECMANQEDYAISWVDMYNLQNLPATAKKQLTKTRIQNLVRKWSLQGYFLEIEDKIYFGPRMIVEYARHLKTYYSDHVKDCPLCKKVVLWDIKCSHCETKVHKECIRTFLKRNSNCPSCSQLWNTPLN